MALRRSPLPLASWTANYPLWPLAGGLCSSFLTSAGKLSSQFRFFPSPTFFFCLICSSKAQLANFFPLHLVHLDHRGWSGSPHRSTKQPTEIRTDTYSYVQLLLPFLFLCWATFSSRHFSQLRSSPYNHIIVYIFCLCIYGRPATAFPTAPSKESSPLRLSSRLQCLLEPRNAFCRSVTSNKCQSRWTTTTIEATK